MFYVKKILIFLIDLYKMAISPYLGHHCRFSPTCSQYAKEQIQSKPLPLALLNSVWRVLCCWPLGDYLIQFEQYMTRKFNALRK